MGTVSKTLCHFSEKLSLFEKSADPHGCRLGFQPLLSETRRGRPSVRCGWPVWMKRPPCQNWWRLWTSTGSKETRTQRSSWRC